jgi:hypothetical protein
MTAGLSNGEHRLAASIAEARPRLQPVAAGNSIGRLRTASRFWAGMAVAGLLIAFGFWVAITALIPKPDSGPPSRSAIYDRSAGGNRLRTADKPSAFGSSDAHSGSF